MNCLRSRSVHGSRVAWRHDSPWRRQTHAQEGIGQLHAHAYLLQGRPVQVSINQSFIKNDSYVEELMIPKKTLTAWGTK